MRIIITDSDNSNIITFKMRVVGLIIENRSSCNLGIYLNDDVEKHAEHSCLLVENGTTCDLSNLIIDKLQYIIPMYDSKIWNMEKR